MSKRKTDPGCGTGGENPRFGNGGFDTNLRTNWRQSPQRLSAQAYAMVGEPRFTKGQGKRTIHRSEKGGNKSKRSNRSV
jgi:hypothetical protein